MPAYEGEMPLGDTEAPESPSGFSVGWDTAKLSYGEGVAREAYTNITQSYPDYADNKEAYDSFSGIDSFMGLDEETRRHTKYGVALREGYFELDEENNVVPGPNYFTGANVFYNSNIVKGALLAQRNGFSEDALNQEYSSITKRKASELSDQKEGTSLWGQIPGILAGHITEPETLIDFMSPGKVMASTPLRGVGKAFAVEAGVAAVGETMREARIREHMERADLDYTLWDSVENILIGSGFAGFIRGIGSAVTDKATFNKINEGITNKTDKEIFARFAQRENYKLTTNSTKHLAVLEKAREDIDAGRQVDVADHLDVDINTKTDDAIEEVNLSDEVKATGNIAPEEIKHFEETIDNPPPVKDSTDVDPYDGMTTPKEADETIAEVMDDPEIKAMFDEIEVEKAKLSPQAQMAKEAKEPAIGGSEDEAKQAVKDVFKKKEQDPYKNYSTEDIEEMDRLFKEDQEMQSTVKNIEDELNADIAGVDGKSVFMGFGPEMFGGTFNGLDYDEETGTFTFDPMRFMTGFLAGHVAKKIAKNPKLNAVAKKEAMAYAERLHDRLKDTPAYGYITGIQKAVDDRGVNVKTTKLTDNEIYNIKPDAEFSGKITLLKNKEPAPNMGARFGQDVEPSGYYAIQKETNHLDDLPNYETVDANIKNPLIVDVSEDLIQWKRDLSKEYNAKGKALTNKLKKKGYDSIITTDNGELGEIIILDTAIISESKAK